MKKLIYCILTLILITIGCSKNRNETTWIIEKIDGGVDTIQAKDYFILTPDKKFLRFITNEAEIIYPKDGVILVKEKRKKD